jgi:catechol 2,3-dioxygenase-like lactoylglutathione lyase family enzyme
MEGQIAVEPRISIITIATDDLDRAVRFYQAMGLQRHPGITDGVAFFQMGGAILGLFPCRDAEKDAGIAFARAPSAVYLAYNTRSDAEVDEVLEMAERAGGKIIKPAGRAFWGGWYGYFADADGHVWEVAHNPAFPIAEDGTISLPA